MPLHCSRHQQNHRHRHHQVGPWSRLEDNQNGFRKTPRQCSSRLSISYTASFFFATSSGPDPVPRSIKSTYKSIVSDVLSILCTMSIGNTDDQVLLNIVSNREHEPKIADTSLFSLFIFQAMIPVSGPQRATYVERFRQSPHCNSNTYAAAARS